MADQIPRKQTIMGVDTPEGYTLYLPFQKYLLSELRNFQLLSKQIPAQTTSQQIKLYHCYLKTRESIIRDLVFTGKIRAQEDLNVIVEKYNVKNALGFRAYVDCYEYLSRLSLGIILKDWKKWKEENGWTMKRPIVRKRKPKIERKQKDGKDEEKDKCEEEVKDEKGHKQEEVEKNEKEEKDEKDPMDEEDQEDEGDEEDPPEINLQSPPQFQQKKYVWPRYRDLIKSVKVKLTSIKQIIMGQNTSKGYALYLNYQQYFLDQLQNYKLLSTEFLSKFTPEQTELFQQYLWVRDDTIRNQVFTGEIRTFDELEEKIDYYNTAINPIGFKLYTRRYERSCRINVQVWKDDWSYWKKYNSWRMRKLVQPKPQPKPKPKVKPQPHRQRKANPKPPPPPKPKKEIIKKTDPEIDLQKLSETKWDMHIYPECQDLIKPKTNVMLFGYAESGKSTLFGRILDNLKLADEMENLKSEHVANIIDKLWDELQFASGDVKANKGQEKTVECSKTLRDLSDRRYTLFDESGYSNYVPDMMNRACQADLAILILSSEEGEFQCQFKNEGCIKEHALRVKTSGVSTLICAVTKMSLSKWSKERYNFIKNTIVPYLENICEYMRVEILPVDSVDNMNIDKRVSSEVCQWYDGPSLLEILNDIEVAPKNPMGPLRIPITDKIYKKGQLFACGRVESGTIIEDQQVTLSPSKKFLKIKQIYDLNDCRIPYAPAGENVKLKVQMIEKDDIFVGKIICNNQNHNRIGKVFRARLHILDFKETKKLISPGSQATIHLYSSVENIQIQDVGVVENPQTRKMVQAKFLRTREVGIVKIKSQNALCFQNHDFMPALGRFTLRDRGRAIAYGEVLKREDYQIHTYVQKVQLRQQKGEFDKETTNEKQQEKLSEFEKPNMFWSRNRMSIPTSTSKIPIDR